MRGFQVPAAAPGVALALLAASVVVGCGTARRPAEHETATAPRAVRTPAASHAAATAADAPSTRLDTIAFVSPSAGYGIFTGQAGGRCHVLAGRTADAGASFGVLAAITPFPCAGYLPATALAADRHGDLFLYDPGFYVSHDGGRDWAPGHQPGTVLSIATAGRSAWMVLARCPRRGSTCALRLLTSADGGRTWAGSPAQPPGATVAEAGGQPAQERAPGQTWLLRTGRSSGYVLSGPAGDRAPMWFTADAGRSWSRREVQCGPVGAISATVSAAPDGSLLGVCAGQPGMGFQAKSAGRSADGGRSWTVTAPCPPGRPYCRRGLPLDFGYLGQIDSVSAATVFLVGERSSLLVTSDGGVHWQPVRPLIGDTSGGTFQVIFVSPRDGFVLGDDARNDEVPTIWRTTDGGMRWTGIVPRP